MPATTEQTTERPIHETIVKAIHRCPGSSIDEILRLFQLIKETKIPKGHDEIMTAIDEQFGFHKQFGFQSSEAWGREIREVNTSLMEQKISAMAATEKKGINLENLQSEIEKLLALLRDPWSNPKEWNESVRNRLQSLQKFISQALSK